MESSEVPRDPLSEAVVNEHLSWLVEQYVPDEMSLESSCERDLTEEEFRQAERHYQAEQEWRAAAYRREVDPPPVPEFTNRPELPNGLNLAAACEGDPRPVPEFADGPELPSGVDWTEVFAAVPPGDLFDAVERTAALGIDRIMYFEKLIAFAQAGKADAINESYTRALAVAETGKATKDRWSGEYAAERGFVLEVACALRIPQATAQAVIRDSQCLVQALPLTRTALLNGEVSERHVRKMIDHVASIPQLAQRDFEEALLPFAKTLTVAQFDVKARKVRERLHPDSIAARRTKCLADRRVQLFPGVDGMSTLWISASSDDMQAAFNRVTDGATGLQDKDETRTLAQLKADVATDLLISGVTETGLGAGLRATVNVTVPVLTLMGKSEEPGELEGYGPIDPETARRLAGTATSFTRILVHPETGVTLSVSEEQFKVPRALKKYLQIRDQTCRVPGCNKAARFCDVDHTIDRQFGGPTASWNLAHLCAADHALKHNTAWTVKLAPDGVMRWTSPAGKHYATDPATRITPLKPPSTSAPNPPDRRVPPNWFDIPDTRNPLNPSPL